MLPDKRDPHLGDFSRDSRKGARLPEDGFGSGLLVRWQQIGNSIYNRVLVFAL